MRILRVASDAYPEVNGGIALHVHHMSRDQAKMGHQVTLLTSDHGHHALQRVEERDGYIVKRHRELIRPVDNSITPGLWSSLREEAKDADVVHAHSHLFFSTNLAALLSMIDDLPLVVTNHGVASQTAPGWVQRIHWPTVARPTLNAADRVLCYTETDSLTLKEMGITTKVKIVPNGIDCERFRPNPNGTGVDNSPKEILFVGRLKPGKGVECLLDAFEVLTEEHDDSVLRIVGGGPLEGKIRSRLGQNGSKTRVKLEGYVPYDEMHKYYERASLFVLPSFEEGLPRTMLEAMASGTPIITSNLPQLEPFTSRGGMSFSRGKSHELAESMMQLLENKQERETLGKRGRAMVREEHPWMNTIEETTRILEEISRQGKREIEHSRHEDRKQLPLTAGINMER